MYSSFFNGWIGKMDEFWTEAEREKLFSSILNYFQSTISPGQKLFIAYDYNEGSKYTANKAATFFSENGVPVFISNRPLTSSMNQIIAKERYGCGTLSFVRDDFSFPFVGLKVTNFFGELISDVHLETEKNNKKTKKQSIEWYDPSLNLKHYLSSNFHFPEKNVAINSLVWNSMYSPSSPLIEELFVDIFNKKSIDAYTINSFENTLPSDFLYDLELQEHIELTSKMMSKFHTRFGVTTTPDLSKFELLIEDNGTLTSSSFENTLFKLVPYLKSKSPIVLGGISLTKSPFQDSDFEIVKVPKEKFHTYIKENDFSLAIDEDLNIYLQNELFPNHFAFLFCLYHSLIYAHSYKNAGYEKAFTK